MRSAIFFLVGGIFGTAFGFAAAIFAYPFLFPPPPAAEVLADADRRNLVAEGQFIHADPSDSIHWGQGKVSVYDNIVFLEKDFKVGPGPKFHVYLVPDANVTPATAVDETMYVDLGQLRSFEGSQRYSIPPGIDLAKYKSVVIWCEHFSVLISPAALQFQG